MQVVDVFGESIEIACRTCSECRESKPLNEFAMDTTYVRSKCKECRKKADAQLKILKKLHPKPDIKTYRCPACHDSVDDMREKGYVKWRQDFVLHHCHKTGKFRGWLCHACNRALGNFQDDLNIVKKAVDYLKNTS
jgi:uncharacterized protein CbrC (UPF0167 family)